jgi:MinD-like ATPase involved in chromosome partitioning or flagellar assembly
MQIIALINQTGGVSKTTCTINIGAGLNKPNKKSDKGLSPVTLCHRFGRKEKGDNKRVD